MTETKKKTTRKPAAKKEAKLKPSVKLVKMVRGETEADVHPEMVEDFAKAGYKEA